MNRRELLKALMGGAILTTCVPLPKALAMIGAPPVVPLPEIRWVAEYNVMLRSWHIVGFVTLEDSQWVANAMVDGHMLSGWGGDLQGFLHSPEGTPFREEMEGSLREIVEMSSAARGKLTAEQRALWTD